MFIFYSVNVEEFAIAASILALKYENISKLSGNMTKEEERIWYFLLE